MIAEADKEFGDSKSINAAIRSAKKASRPTKIGLPEPPKSKARSSSKRSKSSFNHEIGKRAVKKEQNSLKTKGRRRK